MAKPLPTHSAGKARPSRKAKADPEDPDVLRRRGINKDAKFFEEEVAHLFSLLGYRATVDYSRDGPQFDVRLQMNVGLLSIHALVECKNLGGRVTQKQVREFADKVRYAAGVDNLPYQAIVIARSGFANNAHVVAKNLGVHLQTYEELLLSLVDLRPNLDAAVRAFRDTPLSGLYVEQDVVFEEDIKPGKKVERKSLTQEVLRWLDEPSGTFLALLGDFGCGKSSFAKRLACELALKAREELSHGQEKTRVPVLIDLREGGSTTVTLESLLTQHFQRLSSQPFHPQAFFQLNREGYLLLLFDGFDETIAYTEPGRYVDNLRQVLRVAEGKAKVLLTCRTHYFRDRPEALRQFGLTPQVVTTEGATRLYDEVRGHPGTGVGYMLEFREEQIEEYLQKAFPPPADWKPFREQIRQTYNLENLAERPFLLEIIVKTLPRLTERRGNVTLADLYETYCESWFSHTDFRLTLTRDRRVALVEYLARLVWDSPENRVHYDLLFEKATEFFKDRSLTRHDKERIDYEVRTALFLHRDAEGYYSFIHRSFLEFFVARTLRTGLVRGEPGCLALRRITREVAFFFEFWPEAKRIPELAGKVLTASHQPRVSENALFLLYFHARATLGPLVGGNREPDAEQIRETFSKIRPKALHLEGADLDGAVLPGIDLSSARLEGALLRRADLREASLDGSRLARANLAFADFRMGTAESADLSEADLNHLDAQEAAFRKAALRNADFTFARLTRADLSGADLHGIRTVGTGLLRARGVTEVTLARTAGGLKPGVLGLCLQDGHSGSINSVAWSPERRCVATGSDDRTVRVWDAAAGRAIKSFEGHAHRVSTVAWSPDGARLASGSYDRTVKVWDADTGRAIKSLEGHAKRVLTVAWSPDGSRLASGSADGTVKIWDADTGRAIKSLEIHGNWIHSVAWSPDGVRLASGSSEGMVKIWEAVTGRAIYSFEGHGLSVYSVAWSPDGARLASGSSDGTAKVWDADSGRVIKSLEGHGNWVHSVAWSPDGTRLASGSHDRTLKVWDVTTGNAINSLLEGRSSSVNSVAWSLDGAWLASGSSDGTVKIWDATTGRAINFLESQGNSVNSVVCSPDGARLASGSTDGTVKVWDAATGLALKSLEGHGNRVFSVAWSPDGARLASGSDYRTAKVWDGATGRAINSLEGFSKLTFSVAWSPDGAWLASGSDDRTVKIWDAATGRTIQSFEDHSKMVFSVSWSPDGARLASGSYDRTVKIWDTATGRAIKSLEGHGGYVFSVSWSPDGAWLASASDDRTVKVWDAATGRAINSFEGHDNRVFSVSWSPNSALLASASDDGTVKIWDAISGKILATLDVGPRPTSLTWHPTGRWLAVSSGFGFNEIWNLEADPPRAMARLYHVPGGFGLAATPDGYVSGPPEALEWVRFSDGWALYDLTDLPERYSPERVAVALTLGPPPESPDAATARRRPRSPRSRNGKGPGRRSA